VSFLGWTFLFGALAVAGPIVAHLLSKPRFRRVPFTMLRFLRRGQSHTYSRRRLRDVLILLLRCAIIVLIAVLFARPVLHVRSEPPKRGRVIYHLALDDSMSMARRDGSYTLFERMTEKALDEIRQAPDDATFCIYALASGRSSQGLTKGEAFAAVRKLKAVPAIARLNDFLSTLKQQTRTDATRSDVLVLMSDFTPSVLQEFEQAREPVDVDEVRCEPVTAENPPDNAAILSARIAGMVGNSLNVDVTIGHYGPADRQCTLTAQAAGLGPLGQQEIALPPGVPKVVRLQMDLGPQYRRREQRCLPIELMLSSEDDLAEDNTYRLAAWAPAGAQTTVLLVHQADETFLFETAVQALADSGALEGLHLVKVPQGRLTSRELDEADIAVFGCIPPTGSWRTNDLKAFVQKGGRLVFFTTDVQDAESIKALSREGLLAAQPEKWISEIVYPESRPRAEASLALDEQAGRSLCNYRLDRIALKGCWQCRPAAGAECLWQLNAGEGLLYAMPCGRGLSILVNTSIDDSLGLLAKSAAWVAFCRYLIGEDSQVQQFCFTCAERPVLRAPALDTDEGPRRRRTVVPVENCDGSGGQAVLQGDLLAMPAPAGLGWMKTTDDPVLYAGINLPAGETDLTAPGQEVIAAAMQRAFVTQARKPADAVLAAGSTPAARAFRQKPIWPIFAWAAILLLLLESTIANRLRR
jgi:hypothetical protein